MLNHLNIQNIAIVDNLQLDLLPGMTAFTGETGAGKSIIIDALDLALGGRGSAGVIRHGAEKAEVCAIFSIHNIPAAKQWLQVNELENGDEVILRRVLHQEGRSRHFINGHACTQMQVRELGELLLNIHGQHEQQNLLQRDQQREMVDRYANHPKLLAAVQQAYRAWSEKKAALTAIQQTPNEQQAKLELLQYQVKELQELALAENEFSTLESEHKQLTHAEDLRANAQLALQALDAEDTGANQHVFQAEQALQSIVKLAPQLQSVLGMLTTANIQLREASIELTDYLDNLTIDPERLFIVEQRLEHIHRLARKHHTQPEQLCAIQNKLEQELQQLEHRDAYQAQLQQELILLLKQYHAHAEKLTSSRQAVVKKLDNLITASMQTLGMQGGVFAIRLIAQTEPTLYGAEKIEFHVSANPGQPLQSLANVASGGELSRINLALQMITAQQNDTPTLIFDEVDVGIGGGTAEVVGKLLRKLGEKAQVFCITHLPQVAAQAQQHLQVQKHTVNNQTSTTIIALDKQPRIAEIARMLGGMKITQQTLNHAAEMLQGK